MKRLYAVVDIKASLMVGSLMVFSHPAVAVRAFGDVLSDKGSILSRHPQDFNLIEVGSVSDEGVVVGGEPQLVMSGEAWVAAQPKGDEGDRAAVRKLG